MIDPSKLEFSSAKRSYMLANSSAFLLRKLQEDQKVQAVSSSLSADELVEAIRSYLGQPPKDLNELVVPYALLVALSRKGPRARIEEVAAMPSENHEWFAEMADMLIASWKSMTVTNLGVPRPGLLWSSSTPPLQSTNTFASTRKQL